MTRRERLIEIAMPFAVSTALRSGVTRSRLRSPAVFAPFFGIRGAAPTESESREASVRRRADAFAVRMGPSEFFCLVTACVLWGVPLPPQSFIERDAGGSLVERPLDVGVLLPTRAPRGRGVRGRSVTPGMANVVREPSSGLLVTSPATTWAMMGSLLAVEDLVALGDAFVRVPMRPGDPPAKTTIDRLWSAAVAGRRIGAAALREALPQIRLRSRSTQETRTRVRLLDGGLPEPSLNFPVVVDGKIIALLDLAYPKLLLAFEYEGEHHLTDPAQWAADIRRLEMLADLGWRVIRVTKSDLGEHLDQFIARAHAAFRARA